MICILTRSAMAQVRGVYPLGMSATNSGVTPESGVSYVNQFLFYSRDQAKGTHGEVLATGQNSVMMDMNTLVWVSKGTIGFLGGAQNTNEECYLFQKAARLLGMAYVEHQARL